ncbi:MAG TPA: EAL domain-containing protein, partial [Leucothrix sp.]|nr:EAL domain-containing protein [Leucothrix sp.]
LSHASICNPVFTQWMLRSLKHLGKKSKNLTVMIPSQLDSKERKCTVEFVQNIKLRKCQVALNEFTPSSNGLKMLGRLRPSFVRLSLEWVRELESNEKSEIALGGLIRQLEARKIQVIAPCSFSAEMRKIFVFSGASFCQERSTNTA